MLRSEYWISELANLSGVSTRTIRYYIQEGPPTRISRVEFPGAEQLPQRRLIQVLGMSAGDVLNLEELDSGIKSLRAHLRDEGYLEARLQKPELDLESDELVAPLRLPIEPGRRVEVEFTGNQVVKSGELKKVLKLNDGISLTEFGIQDLQDRIVARPGHGCAAASARSSSRR